MHKIKLLSFDFDGVLIHLVEAHYQILNQAIKQIAGEQYIINQDEQNNIYNGLSTKTKLNKLVSEKSLNKKLLSSINILKQQLTLEYIESHIEYNASLRNDLFKLKEEGYLLYCASNAMLSTVTLGLQKLGIYDLFTHIIGNDKVQRQKPAPDIYLECFLHAGVDPKECLIIEDSYHGRMSAIRSGAHLCEVNDPSQCTYNHITQAIHKITSPPYIPFQGKQTLNVIIPMGGAGSRMRALWRLPKPLIDIYGAPMISRVVENLNIDAQYIFIIQEEHDQNYNLSSYLKLIAPGCKIVKTNELTRGAACSILLAKEFINNDQQLLVANSDQIVAWNSASFMHQMLSSNADGGILVFNRENDEKWSYVRSENGLVREVAEKRQISNDASVGIYYFKHGKDYVKYAEEMIEANDMVNNEFYCCPVYNYFIKDNKKIISYKIDHIFGTGVPEDLNYFIANFDKFQHLHHLQKL